LAENGLRFTQAWSPIGLTTAAHASLLTGLTPPHHGLRGNNHHGYRLASEKRTVAEVFHGAGWATAAFVSAWPAGPEGGMDQGFETFSGPESGERPGELAVAEARAWMAARTAPWFLWVHVYEPHGPYVPSRADLRAVSAPDTDRGRYAGEVHHADRVLGPLLSDAVRANASVIVTADHGEVLDEERCGWQHERSASPEVLRIPLVIVHPGGPTGTRDQTVGLMDLFPTLLALAGLSDPGGHDGRDLLSVPIPNRPVWVGESGLCDPECSQGCRPTGFAGKDRVVYSAGTSWLDRPGRSPQGNAKLAVHLGDWPRASTPPGTPDELKGQALGYTDP
jgi:arylsulfatase A-like enzyme